MSGTTLLLQDDRYAKAAELATAAMSKITSLASGSRF